MNLKELYEKRASLKEQMRTITGAAEARAEKTITEEEQDELTRLLAEGAKLDVQIRAAEAVAEADMRLAEQRATTKQEDPESSLETRAFYNYVRSVADPAKYQLSMEERTALTTENGAVMIPKDINQRIVLALQGMFDLMKSVDLRITSHAKTFVEPILSGDMTLKRITIGAANDEGTATFEGIEIKAYDYRLPAIPISITLMEGSDADIQGAIVAMLTEYIARGLANLATVGGTAADGVTAFVPKVPTTTSASATAVSYADLVDLLAKVKAPHNAQGVASFLMNSATRAALMKVLDENGRPIFLESVREGEPDRILGRPVIIDDNMPDIGASKVPIIFGDLKKYVLRIVQGVRVRVYQEEKFYKDNCIGVQAFVTADGKLIAKSGSYEPLAGLKMKSA